MMVQSMFARTVEAPSSQSHGSRRRGAARGPGRRTNAMAFLGDGVGRPWRGVAALFLASSMIAATAKGATPDSKPKATDADAKGKQAPSALKLPPRPARTVTPPTFDSA